LNASRPSDDAKRQRPTSGGFSASQVPGGGRIDHIWQAELLSPQPADPGSSAKRQCVPETSRQVREVTQRIEPEGVIEVRRGVTNVRIQIHVPATEPDRILADKPLQAGVVVPRPIMAQL